MVVAKKIPKRTHLSASAEIFGLQEAHDQKQKLCVGEAIGYFLILFGVSVGEQILLVLFASTNGSSSAARIDAVIRCSSIVRWC